jgi:nucleoside-diphosphate-sugar epimerase
MAKRRVVLTGASGYVAQRMFPELSERWELVPIDVRATTRDGKPVPGIRVADLTDRNRDAYRELFRGADAVLHLGYVSAPGLDANTWQNNSDAKFWAEHDNVALAYNVYRVALEEGVRRVVVASSNHAADYYERLVWADKLDMVTPEMPPRSDNWYGWAKAAYELLGFVFATGKVDGRTLEIAQWRIGGPRDDDLDRVERGDIKTMHRALGAYLSRRDQVQQAIRMVETDDITDEHGVPFLIVYGISGNTHRFWSLAGARQKIGYVPEDDSQVNFADKIAAIAGAAKKPGSAPRG